MLYWLPPSPWKQKSNELAMKGGGLLGVAGDNWGRPGTPTTPPATTNRSTFSRQHRPNDLSILLRDIHIIEIKH
jgi:hypothetical protein